MIPTVQRKFTRKTYRPPPAVAVTTKDYESQLSPEDRYRRHYAMWDFWQDELVDGLASSVKKAIRASEEAVGELQAMQSLLLPDKSQQMESHIARLTRLRHELGTGTMLDTARYRWRMELERQERTIQHDFAWKRVHDHIQAPATASPAEAAR